MGNKRFKIISSIQVLIAASVFLVITIQAAYPQDNIPAVFEIQEDMLHDECGQGYHRTQEEMQSIWLEDFSSFYEMIKNNYPYLWVKERKHGYNWLDLKEQYRKRIRKAKEPIEYLEIIYDAVQALQNRHTRVFEPEWMDYYYRDSPNNFYRTDEPYRSIFTDELRNRYEDWRPFFEELIDKRYWIHYDALIIYDRGVYKIFDGHGAWKEKYGEGSIVTEVNGTSIDKAVKTCYEKTYLDWDFKRKKSFVWGILPQLFESEAEFTIQTTSGEKKKIIFKSGMEYRYNNPYRFPSDRISTNVWDDKKIAYVRINDFSSDHSDEDHDKLLDFYRSVKDYSFLIIDVRWNQGGSYHPWMRNVIAPLAKRKLISQMKLAYRSGEYVNRFREMAGINTVILKNTLTNLPPEVKSNDFTVYDYTQTVSPSGDIDFKGEIIILISKFTYSATDAFALFCKESKFGTLYGTPTGGDGISESPVFYVFPNTKIMVRFTPAMGIDYLGYANEEFRVQPNVYHECIFDDPDMLINFVRNRIHKDFK